MRITFFLILCIVAIVFPMWITLPLSVCYALAWRAHELIILGLLVDAVFGVQGIGFLYYTVSLGSIVFIVEVLKPYLSFYNT